MNKKITVGYSLVITSLAVLLAFMIAYVTLDNKYSKKLLEVAESQRIYEKLNNVDKIVRQRYVGVIDEDKLLDGIIQGYINGLGDKYAAYFNKEQFSKFTTESQGMMTGVGIRVIYNNEMKAIEVITVMPDSPAEREGLLPGDMIVQVDGDYISELGYAESILRFRKELGSIIDVTIRRGTDFQQELNFSMTVENVETDTVQHRMLSGNVGFIRLLEFDKTTPDEFKAAMEELKNAGAVKYIFDVRENPGGDLDGITAVLDYLLPEGPIIKITSKVSEPTIISSDASCVEAPMAVLINGKTASAAELFTSALRDYNKAVLVGTKTYGKGTMQSVMRLPDNSGISVSVSMYNPPVGDNYEGVGIQPDIEVTMPEDLNKSLYKLTEQEDVQLQAALAALQQ
ncbi:MAG: S41 family peptidase [Eubacteriales bacterium]